MIGFIFQAGEIVMPALKKFYNQSIIDLMGTGMEWNLAMHPDKTSFGNPLAKSFALKKRQMLLDFIFIAVPVLILLVLTFTIIHYYHYMVTRQILEVRESSYIKIGHEAIRNDVQTATSDLTYLADSTRMQALLMVASMETKAQLAEEFHSMMKAKKKYDQIRYIDATGMEVVRVNYNAGTPLTVPADKLQNKGKRYYFADAFKLGPREIFVSPMDLNIENGRIERPIKPMLRFGMPVFDRHGQKKGVVLINYFADTIRANISHFLGEVDSRPMLLNAQGYWLMSPEPKDEWGFMFKNQRRFDQRHPKAWEAVVRDQHGQVRTADGLFTFTTIYPLLESHTSSSGAAEAFAQSAHSLSDSDYYWVLVTHISQAQMNAHIQDHIQQGALQCGAVSLIILPLIWLFSRERIVRKWARSELRHNEQYLRTITAQLGEGLLVINRKGEVLTMNQEAEQLLGWQAHEIIGRNLGIVFPLFPEDLARADDKCLVARAINERIPYRKDSVSFRRKQGGSISVSFSVAPLQKDQHVLGAIITFRDITERLQLQAELQVMAKHDPLTGVKNRGEIERLLHQEWIRAERYQHQLAILMLDIDHFKQINDIYGHQAGDKVLQHACTEMERQLRESDQLGRYGGEEFLIVLPETNLPSAQTIAERLRRSMADLTVSVDSHTQVRFTVSIGVGSYPGSAQDVEKLVQLADRYLYKAKNSGRNRVMATNLTLAVLPGKSAHR